MIDIKKSLQLLGVQKNNNGTSVGLESFGGGDKIDSISPVDGLLIGSVTKTTQEEYETAI
jgi:aldehyde dehydrogenase (NAD+)